MNIFENLFHTKKAFVAYLTGGHRGREYTEQAAVALINGGVDILEIGVPFSDPIADGPVIQKAMMDALSNGTDIHMVLEVIRHIKQRFAIPIVLFTYLNPLLAVGLEQIFDEAASAGVDAILVVDLPIEESRKYFELCKRYAIEPVCLVSPSTSNNRVEEINAHCNSFLYYVCRNGTTGVKNSLPEDYAEKVNDIKLHAKVPVVTGFGIGSKTMAHQVLQHADGFVVGSAFVKAISQGASPKELQQLAINLDPR